MARNRRRLLPAVVALVAAVVLSGCLAVLKSQSAEQLDQIGDVRVTSTLCIGFEAVQTGPDEGECEDYSGGLTRNDPRLADLLTRMSAAREDTATRASARAVGTPPTHEDVIEGLLGGIGLSQITFAYKIPEGATAPETIDGTIAVDPAFSEDMNALNEGLLWPLIWGLGGLPAGEFPDAPEPAPQIDFPSLLTFHQRASLADELGDPGEGMQWVGYVSDQLPAILTGEVTLDAVFGLPDTGNAPYAGPFAFETVAGDRLSISRRDIEGLALAYDAFDLDQFLPEVLDLLGAVLDDDAVIFLRDASRSSHDDSFLDAVSPERSVDCEEELFGPGSQTTNCIVDPGFDTSGSVATRDLRIAAAGTPQARQGETALVPFTLTFAGPAASDAFALGGQTGLPFSSATPDPASWTPAANEQRTVNVAVPVPDDARPGLYQAELIASVGDEQRSAVGTFEVLAKEAVGGAASSVQTLLLGRLAPRGVTASVRSNVGNAARVRRARRARLRARAVRLRARAAAKGGWTLRTSGRVRPPASLTNAEACQGGIVAVTVKSGQNTVSHRSARLRPDCRYVSSVTFTVPGRFTSKRAKVIAKFRGNNRMLPRRAKTARLRVPRFG